MRMQIGFLALSAVLSSGSAHAASVELRDAVMRVTVVPEDRTDIKVEIARANPDLPVKVSVVGDRTIVDGGLRGRIGGCGGMDQNMRVRVRGVGPVAWADMPQVVVRTPRSVNLSSSGAVVGVMGRSGDLDLRNSGCSRWTIADVAGAVTLQESGAGFVRMGASERLDVTLSGAGNVRATRVRQQLVAQLSGAGDIQIDEVRGSLDARVSGAGQIKVANGNVRNVRAAVSGLGNVSFDGTTEALQASISGLGGVRIREVTGSVSKSVSGRGSVRIGNRPA